jgi:hypothetical protein
MTRVLCGVDGSPAALAAAESAIAFCGEHGADLELLSVVEPGAGRARAAARFEEAVRLAEAAGLEPVTTSRAGRLLPELQRRAHESGAHILVFARTRPRWWAALSGRPRSEVLQVPIARRSRRRTHLAAVTAPPTGPGATRRAGRPRVTTTRALFASIGLFLLAYGLVFALVLDPPVLGWIGFAFVCVIALGVATVATMAAPRLRFNPPQPAASRDGRPRLLVVADEHCGSPGLWREIHARLADAVAVHLVVPVRVSHLHYLTNDERHERVDADHRVRLAVRLLRQRGVAVTGGVGGDDPLESMTDALAWFPATRVLLATSTAPDSYWLEDDLVAKARTLTTLEVSQVVVPPAVEPRMQSTEARWTSA